MKLSHLNALRALEASVRLGSFRGAARELNVTAAAVGQQVKRLEEATGCLLLKRTPNGFVPTELARQVADKLEPGFGHLAGAMDLISRRSSALRLAISVVPSIAENWLAPRLPEFQKKHPGIDLQIDTTSTILDPDESDFDFAFRYGPEAPGATDSLDLFPEYLLPTCTPDLAAQIDVDNRADPFGGVPLLHTVPSTSDPRWMDWPQWCAAMGYGCPRHSSGTKFTFTTMALRAMFSGNGIYLAQLSIVLPALLDGRLAAPFGSGCSVRTGYPYRLVRFGPQEMTRLGKGFRGWVAAESQGTERSMRDYLV